MGVQGQWSGAPEEDEQEDESLITEILTAALPKLVDSSVACLISWAGDDIVDRGDHFEPSLVRIGPFHRQDPSKRSADRMEQKKKLVLRGLLLTSSSKEEEEEEEEDEAAAAGRRREELRSHLEAMELTVDDVRRCYNRSFSWMNSKEFARMLLLDGCFLYSRFFVSGDGDDIAVDRDVMFLLENQIPFLVLEKIHHRLKLNSTSGIKVQDPGHVVLDKVAQRVQQVLRCSNYIDPTNVRVPSSPGEDPPCHLLHLLYMHLAPTSSTLDSGPPKQHSIIRVPVPPVRWRTATQYAAAGVRFVKRKLGGNGDAQARSILDVELIRDQLHIPCLTIDSNTFRLLRNMVAMEHKSLQQQQRRSSHVTAYCLFMSQLAGTEEDVELLVSRGVIVHLLRGNGDVAEGLAGLCDGVVIDAYDPDGNYLRSKHEALEKLIVSGGGARRKCYSMAWLRSRSKCGSNCLLAALVVLLFLWTAQQSVLSALRNCKCRS